MMQDLPFQNPARYSPIIPSANCSSLAHIMLVNTAYGTHGNSCVNAQNKYWETVSQFMPNKTHHTGMESSLDQELMFVIENYCSGDLYIF